MTLQWMGYVLSDAQGEGRMAYKVSPALIGCSSSQLRLRDCESQSSQPSVNPKWR